MVMNAEFPATVIADLNIEAEDSIAGSDRCREKVRVYSGPHCLDNGVHYTLASFPSSVRITTIIP